MTNFRVKVNPFKRNAIINTNIDDKEYSLSMNYDEINTITSFELGGQKFKIEFSIDNDYFLVNILGIVNGQVDFKKNINVQLSIKLADYYYPNSIETPTIIRNDSPVPIKVIVLSNLYKIGASLSKMADSYYGDKKFKMKISRELKKLSIKYPTLFARRK
jgi:hypothetical protein